MCHIDPLTLCVIKDALQHQCSAEASRLPDVQIILGVAHLQSRVRAKNKAGCLHKASAALSCQVTTNFISAPTRPEQGMHQNPLRIVSGAAEAPQIFALDECAPAAPGDF